MFCNLLVNVSAELKQREFSIKNIFHTANAIDAEIIALQEKECGEAGLSVEGRTLTGSAFYPPPKWGYSSSRRHTGAKGQGGGDSPKLIHAAASGRRKTNWIRSLLPRRRLQSWRISTTLSISYGNSENISFDQFPRLPGPPNVLLPIRLDGMLEVEDLKSYCYCPF